MVATSNAIEERIEVARREQTARLAKRSEHFTTERDTITGGHIVRNPRTPGRIEVVSATGECSCQRFRLWGRCRHAAIVETRHGIH